MTKKATVTLDDPLFGFYERLSYHQIDLRDKLYVRFQIFLVGAIPLLGYLGTLLCKTEPSSIAALPSFALIAISSLASLLISSFCFILSYCAPKYSFMAYAKNIEEYRKHPSITLKDFRSYLLEDLIDTCSKNAQINDRRSKQILIGNIFFAASIVLSLVASINYWYKGYHKVEPIYKIEITNATKGEPDLMSSKPSQPKPTNPKKPLRPPQREVRETPSKKKS